MVRISSIEPFLRTEKRAAFGQAEASVRIRMGNLNMAHSIG